MSIEVNATEQIIEVNATGSTIDINVSSQTVDVNATTSVIEVTASYNPGINLPNGGLTGQVLKKQSNTDYDTYWAADTAGVPYLGATGNVDIGEHELKAGQFTLDTSPTGTATAGTTRWNNTTGISETTLKGGSVVLKNGMDLVVRVVNKVIPNATLTKAQYQAVRVSGAQGQRLAVAYAQANNDNNSADTIGLVTETIPTNQEGFVMTVGSLEGINTTGSLQGETWTDGDVIYLSPTTAGALTNVKPSAPGHIVVIGYVEYAHANNGKIYVKVMNGWELEELHDVAPTPYIDKGVLYRDTATNLWKSATISTLLGYTPANTANVVPNTRSLTINGTSYDLSADRSWSVGTVTSVALTVPTGLVITSGSPITSSGTIAVGLQSGYSIPTTIKQGNWDDAYTFVSGFPSQSGNSGKYLTTDGNTLSWGTISTSNIYNADGTLTGNRTVTSGGYSLKILGGIEDVVGQQIGLKIETSTTNKTASVLEINNTYTTTGKKWQLRALSNGDFDISNINDNTARLTLKTNGNISLINATQLSTAALSINGTTATSGGVQIQGSVNSPTGSGIELEYTSGTSYFTSYNRTSSSWLPIVIRGSQIDFTTNGSNTSRFTSAGRLLLGTTTESTFLLDANGKTRVSGEIVTTGTNENINIHILNETQTVGYRSVLVGRTQGSVSGVGIGFSVQSNGGVSIGGAVTSVGGVAIGNSSTTNNGVTIGGTSVDGIAIRNATSNFQAIAIGNGANAVATTDSVNSIAIGNFSYADNNSFVSGSSVRPITNVYFGSGISNLRGDLVQTIGAGTSYAINGSGANGTNFAGGDITIAGGKGTGTGTPGDIILSTATATTTGTTLQSLTQRWWVKGSTGILANVSSPNASAQLQIDSTTKGFLPPRMTSTQRTAISTPAVGLVVYQTDATEGLYQYLSTGWSAVGGGTNIYNSDGTLTGNRTVTSGGFNLTFTGTDTGTTGTDERYRLTYSFSPTSGTREHSSLSILSTINQTGGSSATTRGLYVNPTLTSATDWHSIEWGNIAGWGLYGSGTANNYINGSLFIGSTTNAGFKLDVVGGDARMNGVRVGRGGGNIGSNTILGVDALFSNTSGGNNTVVGAAAGYTNTTGSNNSILGANAGNLNNGSNNVILGYLAATKISGGVTTLTLANTSIFIGRNTKALANSQTNQIVIGDDETGLGSNTTIIGNSSTLTTAIRGRLLLGTTTDSGSYQLDVQGTGRFTGMITSGNGLFDAPTSNLVFTVSSTSGNRNVQIGNFGGVTFTGIRNVAIGSNTINTNTVSHSTIIGSGNSSNGGILIGYNNTTLANNGIAIGLTVTSHANSCVIGTEFGTSSSGSGQFVVEASNWFIRNPALSGQNGSSGTINGCGVSGTDLNGGNITIAGGKGTGTGTSGDVIFSTATPTTTGTTLQSLTNRWWVKGSSGALANVSSPNASAIFQADSTTQGILAPRMTAAQRTAISTPAVGLIVYQTDATEGTYEYTSTGWRIINAAAGGGSGTVTSVSVVSANGFAGTVANASTTPAITISTTVTGLLKGNGTAISAATAGTDYLTPSDVAYSVANVSTTHTETATKGTKIIKADTTGGAFTVNLPTAVGNTATIIIKKVAGSGALTIDGNGTETIDGGTTATINKVYESITLVSDNSNWQIV